MAAQQATPSLTVAELLALRQQVGQTRLAAGQTIRRAVGIYAQATKQHAELVRARRLPQARVPTAVSQWAARWLSCSSHRQPCARPAAESSVASLRGR